ncbi:hypothetical protein EXN66_Car017021 [Channa argus]|uniref:Uncharacterized protein n=1 Tax=Channa argus TaxID=215402 RepID=A0A6G1QG77_CHAAH|nr:hypothetical protein EXN66_Car017021 [Channa argus]
MASVRRYIHIVDFISLQPLLFPFGLCLSFPSQSQSRPKGIITTLRRKLISL